MMTLFHTKDTIVKGSKVSVNFIMAETENGGFKKKLLKLKNLKLKMYTTLNDNQCLAVFSEKIKC